MNRELSVGEVADRLGVSEKSIYREIYDGKMGFFYKVRGVYRASLADLEAYIGARKKEAEKSGQSCPQ